MTSYVLGQNPFKRNAKGEIEHPDVISTFVRRDPELAKRLAKEAGEPISNWISTNPR